MTSFQAVGPEDPNERGQKPVVQDRGTGSLFAPGMVDRSEKAIASCIVQSASTYLSPACVAAAAADYIRASTRSSHIRIAFRRTGCSSSSRHGSTAAVRGSKTQKSAAISTRSHTQGALESCSIGERTKQEKL